jgi:hypothetical protein
MAIAGGVAVLGTSIPPLVRARSTICLLGDLRRINLRAILRAAAEAGVQWGTLEELARQIKAQTQSTPVARRHPSDEGYSSLKEKGVEVKDGLTNMRRSDLGLHRDGIVPG